MRNVPFIVSYGAGKSVILSDGTTTVACTLLALAAAIAAINASPTTYGLGAGLVVPSLPAIPTGSDGYGYFQNRESMTFVGPNYTYGADLPSTALDALLVAATLAVIGGLVGVNSTIAPLITTGPITKTVAAPNATTFVVAASGAATLLYQWQKSTDTGATWTSITNAGVYTTATTNTLNISDTTGLTLTQYRCRVTNNVGVRYSAAAVLTVTP